MVVSLILILSLIPILSNIKQSSKSNAEQVGSSPNNSSTSTIKSLYDNLVTLNHGTSTNYWQRIQTAGEWVPDDVTTTPDQVECGVEYYAGNNRQKHTGTKNCPVPLTNYTRGSDVYVSGNGFTPSSIAQVGGTDCQSTKYITDKILRCTIPSKPHNSTQTITVTTAGTADPNQTVTYNNNSQGNMQDFTSETCQTLSRGQAIFLTDTRNSRSYRIKKMADDKCWMIDNLRYAHSSWTQSASGQYMTYDGSEYGGSNFNVYRYKDPGNSTSGCPPGSTANCYGYLYNWYTATGGTGLFNTSTNGQNATGNICPNNSDAVTTNPAANKWQLPTGGGYFNKNYTYNSDLAILNSSIHNDTGTNTPPNIGLSAYSDNDQHSTYYPLWQPSNTFQSTFSGYYTSSLYGQSSDGYFWSSTARSDYYAFPLRFKNNLSYPGSNYGSYKSSGYAIRCLVR